MRKLTATLATLTALSLGLSGGLVANASDHATFMSAFDHDDRSFYSIDVDEQTPAPQQVVVRAHLHAPADVVFAKTADHRNLRDWVPMIEHLVEVDHSNSATPGENDVGTARVCVFGGDTLTEDIVGWEEGRAYAYSVRQYEGSPTTDHLGVITVEDDGMGGSYITWRQFFEPVGFKGRFMMPRVMSYVMDSALENLIEEYGGGELVSEKEARSS